jgi:hypothetical protein
VGFIALVVAIVGVAVSVGVSRSGFGPRSGLCSRYITIATPVLGAVYIAWLIYGPARARLAIQISLLALVCAGIPAQARFACAIGEARRAGYVKIERGLKRGVLTSRLLDESCRVLLCEPARLHEYIKMLQAARVGKFRFLVDDEIASKPEGHPTVR